MNTATSNHPPHVLGVVTEARTYRNLAYLIVGLPLGTLWFSVLVTALSVGVSMLVVALLGIPILLGTWYAVRAFANVERVTANRLLDTDLRPASYSAPKGNLWVRLKAMSADRARWREAGFLLLRFPAGIATFTAAVTALTVPFAVAYAPIAARIEDEPFGNWSGSARMEDIAGSPWSWLLVVLGAGLFVAALHLINAIADACARWAQRALGN